MSVRRTWAQRVRTLLAIVLALAAFSVQLSRATPAAAGGRAWPQAGYDARKTSYNPTESQLSVANVGSLRRLWTADVRAGLNDFGISSAPSVAGGVVYAASDDERLYAFRAATGRDVYAPRKRSTYGCDSGTSPAIVGNVVIEVRGNCTESGGGGIQIIDRSTGTVLSLRGKGYAASATVADGVGFGWEGSLYGPDPPTLFSLDPPIFTDGWSQPLDGGGYGSPPAVENGVVYEATSFQVAAFDADTGAPAWSTPASAGSHAATLVSDGVVYASGNDETLALDASDGSVLWSTTATGGGLALANSILVVGGVDGLSALDPTTGETLWHRAREVSAPIVANGVVYTGGFRVRAFDISTGRTLWRSRSRHHPRTPSLRYTSPVAVNGRLFAGLYRRLIAWSIPT
jgi:outer membrane protein assembly factor BamB